MTNPTYRFGQYVLCVNNEGSNIKSGYLYMVANGCPTNTYVEVKPVIIPSYGTGYSCVAQKNCFVPVDIHEFKTGDEVELVGIPRFSPFTTRCNLIGMGNKVTISHTCKEKGTVTIHYKNKEGRSHSDILPSWFFKYSEVKEKTEEQPNLKTTEEYRFIPIDEATLTTINGVKGYLFKL